MIVCGRCVGQGECRLGRLQGRDKKCARCGAELQTVPGFVVIEEGPVVPVAAPVPTPPISAVRMVAEAPPLEIVDLCIGCRAPIPHCVCAVVESKPAAPRRRSAPKDWPADSPRVFKPIAYVPERATPVPLAEVARAETPREDVADAPRGALVVRSSPRTATLRKKLAMLESVRPLAPSREQRAVAEIDQLWRELSPEEQAELEADIGVAAWK